MPSWAETPPLPCGLRRADEEASTAQDEPADETATAGYFLQAQLHLANIIGEVHMSRGNFQQTITVIRGLEERGVCDQAGLPLDLSTKAGICLAYCSAGTDQELLHKSESHLAELFKHPAEVYPDLYLDVAEAYVALGFHEKAIPIYDGLLKDPDYDQPGIWLKLGRCHKMIEEKDNPDYPGSAAYILAYPKGHRRAEGGGGGGGGGGQPRASSGTMAAAPPQQPVGPAAGQTPLAFYTKVLEAVPSNCEAAMAIAEIYIERGEHTEALATLQKVKIPTVQVSIVHVLATPPATGGTAAQPAAAAAGRPAADTSEEAMAAAEDPSLAFVDETTRLNRHESGLGLWHGMADAPCDEDGVRLAAARAMLIHWQQPYSEGFLSAAWPLLVRAVSRRCNIAASATRLRVRLRLAPGGMSRELRASSKATTGKASAGGSAGSAGGSAVEADAAKAAAIRRRRILRKRRRGPPTIYEVLDRVKFGELATAAIRAVANKSQSVSEISGTRSMSEAALWLAHAMLPDKQAGGNSSGIRRTSELRSVRHLSASQNVQPDVRLTNGHQKALRFDEVALAVELADYSAAHDSVGYVASQRPHNIRLWNLYYSIVRRLGSQQFEALRKPLVRLLLQHPGSLPLTLLVGHHCAANRDLGLALAEYLQAYRKTPADPIISLLIGVSYLTLVMQKNTINRHQVALRAFVFLSQYHRLLGRAGADAAALKREAGDEQAEGSGDEDRQCPFLALLLTFCQKTDAFACGAAVAGPACDAVRIVGPLMDQERNYNLGRAFHQIGVVHLAVPYYERVLAYYGGDGTRPAEAAVPGLGLGLRREAAHNLVRIYKASGSLSAARLVMMRHLTI